MCRLLFLSIVLFYVRGGDTCFCVLCYGAIELLWPFSVCILFVKAGMTVVLVWEGI